MGSSIKSVVKNLRFNDSVTSKIIIPSNLSNALSISDTNYNYMNFSTSTGIPQINILQNTSLSGYLKFDDTTTPSNPSAGQGLLYKKPLLDEGLYWKPEAAGTEYNLTTGSDLDFQQISDNTVSSTTSTTFTDFTPSVTLTTSSVRPKKYLVIFTVTVQNSSTNSTVFTQLVIDGVADATSIKSTTISRTTSQQGFYNNTSILLTSSLVSGKVIKAQLRTSSGGTATATGKCLVIYGIS